MRGMYDYFWSHALVSDERHDNILKNCNFSSIASVTKECNAALDRADTDVGEVFIYDIYAPWCSSNSTVPSVHINAGVHLTSKLENFVNFFSCMNPVLP